MILSLIVSLLELIDRSMITSRSMFSSLWVSRTGSASDFCALQEALCKCIDTIQYNTIQYNAMQCNTIQCNAIQYIVIFETRNCVFDVGYVLRNLIIEWTQERQQFFYCSLAGKYRVFYPGSNSYI